MAAITPAVAQIGASGIDMVSNLANIYYTNKNNRQAREFAEAQNNKARAEALGDFAATNAYNSPEQQMNRLRQAGLNPNLVYGKGADNTASVVRSSNANAYSPIAPKLDLSSAGRGLSNYYAIQQQVATTDNIHEQTKLAVKEQLLKDTQTIGETIKNSTTQYQLDLARKLQDGILRKQLLENKILEISPDVTTKKLALESAQTKSNLAKQLQEISQSKTGQQATKQEMVLRAEEIKAKEYENRLKAVGLDPRDPVYIRLFNQFLKNKIPEHKYTPLDSTTTGKWLNKHFPNKNK